MPRPAIADGPFPDWESFPSRTAYAKAASAQARVGRNAKRFRHLHESRRRPVFATSFGWLGCGWVGYKADRPAGIRPTASALRYPPKRVPPMAHEAGHRILGRTARLSWRCTSASPTLPAEPARATLRTSLSRQFIGLYAPPPCPAPHAGVHERARPSGGRGRRRTAPTNTCSPTPRWSRGCCATSYMRTGSR